MFPILLSVSSLYEVWCLHCQCLLKWRLKTVFPQGLQGGEARGSRLHWLCGQHHGSGHARVSIQCVLAAFPVCCAGGVWGRKSVDTAWIATCVTSLRDMGGGGGIYESDSMHTHNTHSCSLTLSFSVILLCCRYFDWLFTQASSSMVDDDVKIYFLQALLEVRITCIWSVLYFPLK